MMLTIPVCAKVARSRISKIDVWADGGLNAAAALLNVGADVIGLTLLPTDSYFVQARRTVTLSAQ
jgi:hypothetical protein